MDTIGSIKKEWFITTMNGATRSLPISSLLASTSTPSPSSASNGPQSNANFSYVCDPIRFKALGLDVSNFSFCDKSLSYTVRVKDLIDRMTLAEKGGQLGNFAFGVPQLGLPKYDWWSEALHGVSNFGGGVHFDQTVPSATNFPAVILLAASFNQSLWKNAGQIVSTEARAMYNLGRAGLTYWSPTINVVRDPRWGRITETPGEDPFVVGTYAVNYVRGLQDIEGEETPKDLKSRPLKVSACCKHYTAYDVDHWQGVDRMSFDAKVSEQDIVETFSRPFEMCVREGDASSVMCSYNRVNGIPTCADPKLLKQTIRDEWGLNGYIVSDCDSIETLVDKHKWLGFGYEEAVAQVLKAGLDLDCGVSYTKNLESSTLNGKIREADIDKALNNVYVVLMRLGFFDGSNPSLTSLGKESICSNEHIELSAEGAREGIVLLKNQNSTLPLNNLNFKNIALIGPHANATSDMLGTYIGVPCKVTSPFVGFSAFASVTYSMGCTNVQCQNDSMIYPAMEVAKNADATIIVAGLNTQIENEGLDRMDLNLPGYQNQLIKQVAGVSKGPVILVIMSAGGVDISFAKQNDSKISSIVWAGYPGEEGGRAIAEVVFGKYNPGGKLPITWHENGYIANLPMTSMPLRPVDELGYPGRTYKFFNGSTVYPFGYGLSYTQFNYKIRTAPSPLHITLNKSQHCRRLSYGNDVGRPLCEAVLIDDLNCSKLEFGFEIEVQNVGKMDGSDVLIIYSVPPAGIKGTHSKQVIGFQRVIVPAGQSKNLKFVFNACKSLMAVEKSSYTLLPSGGHMIMVGDGSAASFTLQVGLHPTAVERIK
ncbi:beta-xylosidase/alpha-L-arabinofuranosidase 1-like isoform X3 [Macadamia integrifolia]|uniref:beta-xylosidase/alpha-L-arabinofuranosidase 1-like isoform X3 n=1 Tax=Macadamia integrifolia TaxID=60698 RepID=UPI001C52AD5E|nr:beta-xylosidase/alpha-L-arabinofuranosidase 1-like isoform X3 [Macadamia integrifolia]